jgi:hypothetical protein
LGNAPLVFFVADRKSLLSFENRFGIVDEQGSYLFPEVAAEYEQAV